MHQFQSRDQLQSGRPIVRQDSRDAVDSEIFIKQQGSRLFRATLSNLSVSGFRMESWTSLNPQQLVFIRLPGIQLLSARIRWVDYNDYGCEFTNHLHPAILQHLLDRLNSIQT